MKAALLEINLDMRSLPDRTDGGKWTTRGVTSEHDYEVECQMAIAGFIAEHQERDDIDA